MLCLHLKNPVPIPSPCSVMGNPLPSPLFPVLYVFSRHSWAEPKVLGHYQASDFSAVQRPARALCVPVMIQGFVSRPNLIAPLDNSGPCWEWQRAVALLGEHGPFVQRYSRMDGPTEHRATHKATSVLPLALQLPRAPCTTPAALGMPLRAGGQAGSRETEREKLGGVSREARSPKLPLGAGHGCSGVTFQSFPSVCWLLQRPLLISTGRSIPKSKESCWCGSHKYSTSLALPGMQVKTQWFLAKNLVKQSSSSMWKSTENYPWKYHQSLVKPNSLRKVWELVLIFL